MLPMATFVALQQGPSAVAERTNYRANIDALKRAE